MRIRIVVVLVVLLGMMVPLGAPPAWAQQTQKRSEVEFLPVAPPPEPSYRLWEPYNLSGFLEFGGQIVDVSGNNDVYRSHQNYRDGFKVFSFNFRGHGQDGAFFTDFYVQGTGWGHEEPYSYLRYGFSKDKWFEFRGTLRQSDYDWLFPSFARTQHVDHTQRRLQSYDLTVLPQRKMRVKLGYSRNSSFGPSLTTADFSRDIFLFGEPIRQTYDEYTVGAEVNVQRWLFAGEFGYRLFRNDRFVTLTESPNQGNFGPPDTAFLNVYNRFFPGRGKFPFVRFNVVGRPHRTVEVNTRVVYSRGKFEFTRLEMHDGTTFAGPTVDITQDIASLGEIRRPMTTVDANVTWRPWRQLTLTNNFHFQGYNIAGSALEGLFRTCTPDPSPSSSCPFTGLGTDFFHRFFDLDTFSNRFEGRYDFNRWLGVRAGFSYLHRDFRFHEFEVIDNPEEFEIEAEEEEFDFLNRSFLFGVLVRPNRRLNFFFDLERGNNTRVFTRLSPANIDRIRLRGRWEPVEGVHLAGSWFLFDNSNHNLPIRVESEFGFLPFVPDVVENPDAGHSSRNRGFSIDFQLARYQRGYLNIGYSRNDITVITDVAFFATGFPFVPQLGQSVYVLNSNYTYIDFGGRIAGNLYGDAGYRVVFDTGTFPASDPVDPCNPFVLTSCEDITGLAPLGINWGGLNYHQPHAGLRYAFSDNVSWKVVWRWYGYNVKGGTFSDYKAHIVSTSLVLSL